MTQAQSHCYSMAQSKTTMAEGCVVGVDDSVGPVVRP